MKEDFDIARGKRKDNGKWIEGQLVKRMPSLNIGKLIERKLAGQPLNPKKIEYTIDGIPVESEFQYFTKRLDKNEEKIFSGDTVRYQGKDYKITYDEENHNFTMGGIGFEFYCGTKIQNHEMEIVK